MPSFASVFALPAALVGAFVVYCGMCVAGRAPVIAGVKHNEVLGHFLARFVLWLLSPLERALVGRVSPNAITAASFVLCAVSGIAAALGHLAAAAWAFAFGGFLDMLDGRIARTANRARPSGALFDSVADRWGDLSVFVGYAWFLRGSPWQLGALVAIAGSTMVSYTRARAEALGVASIGGVMQRAERIALTVCGSLVAVVAFPHDTALVVGATLLLAGAASIVTALNRWRAAHAELARREVSPRVRAIS